MGEEEIWGLREESYDVVVWGITGSPSSDVVGGLVYLFWNKFIFIYMSIYI
jgi:hypothetical protein